MKYLKRPLTYLEQVSLLQSRALIVRDVQGASDFLSKVNYYRFSAYCLPFEGYRHRFKPNVFFEDIVSLYKFDQQLRQLIDNALEVLEIYFRAKLTYILTLKCGSFVHEMPASFYSKKDFDEWIQHMHQEIVRSRETFVLHYKNKYEDFPKLPMWIAVEVMSFGVLSRLFHNLKREYQAEIGRELKVNALVLGSWLHAINFIRNVCAHHARLWNREMAIATRLPKSVLWEDVNQKRLGSVLYVISDLLKTIPSATVFYQAWKTDISLLITEFNNTDYILKGMAFSLEHPLWQ